MQPSSTALAAAGRALASKRDVVVSEWAEWIHRRLSSHARVPEQALERQLALQIDLLVLLTGPLRRLATEHWLTASEWYGRTAALRGLATGEVVEEFQYLRELLILHLSETITEFPPRQSIATVLRLNRYLDQGIAHAVVGYTDSLVETLLNRRGVPVSGDEDAEAEIAKRLEQFIQEVAALDARRASSTESTGLT